MDVATHSDERTFSTRLFGFLAKPWRDKVVAIRFHMRRPFQRLPSRTRLPWGDVWLVWPDKVSGWIASGGFEESEIRFVERFLEPGMSVLDVGAHNGLYSLLASRRLGPTGRVDSFEPSARERHRLRLHLWLNHCRNVRVHDFAVGAEEADADLYRVDSGETGCNSLRPPAVEGKVRRLRVRVKTLDEFVRREEIERIDFIKLDVEGAEWSVLRGAGDFLAKRPRPVILMEISDLRTAAWGYSSTELMSFVESLGFRWFEVTPEGRLNSAKISAGPLDANRVAVPEERLPEVIERFCAAGGESAAEYTARQTRHLRNGSC
jgi:FkbM family methyltransferase